MSQSVDSATYRATPWASDVVRRQGARLRLFCFPYAGGGASEYRSWSSSLGERVEVWPVQLPGRETRMLEPPFDRPEPLLDGVIAAFAEEWRHPFALFGHSMGALIAFELTRELRRRGMRMPQGLILSGRGSPRYRDPARPLYALPDAAFIERLRELGGTPEEVLASAELRELYFPILRADFAICERYRYRTEAPLDIPLTVFGGSRDKEHPPELLDEWRRETTASFALHMFPGDHFFIRTARDAVLAALERELTALRLPQ